MRVAYKAKWEAAERQRRDAEGRVASLTAQLRRLEQVLIPVGAALAATPPPAESDGHIWLKPYQWEAYRVWLESSRPFSRDPDVAPGFTSLQLNGTPVLERQ